MRHRRLFFEWLLIGIGASLITLLAIRTSLVERADRLLYDSIAPLHAAPADDRLVIVEIDDEALAGLGRWPWPRHLHADIIRQIGNARPSSILYDILFIEPSDEDSQLAQAIAGAPSGTAPPVYLPMLLEVPGTNGEAFTIHPPTPPIAAAAKGVGTANLSLDSDGRARSIMVATPAPDGPLPHMAELAYRQMNGLPSPAFLRTRATGEALHLPFLPRGSFRSIGILPIMRGEVPASFLRGKVILIGGTAEGLGDIHPISTIRDGRMPGIEVQANLLSSMLADRFIDIAPQRWVVLFSLLPLWGLLIGFWRLSPSKSLFLSLGAIIAIIAGSAVTLMLSGWWFPPMAALLGIVLVYPLWGWRRLVAVTHFMGNEVKSLLEQTGIAAPEPERPWSEDRIGNDAERLHQILVLMQRSRKEREEMLQFLSHDMRSPQASIIALLEDGKNKPADEQVKARIRRYAEHTLSLADGFVQLARLESRPPATHPVDIADAMAQAVDMVWAKAQARHITIERQAENGPDGWPDLWVAGDAEALVRSFANLLGNAIMASPEGSTVRCSTRCQSGTIAIACVEDEGPGLPPERRDDPFGRFGYSSAGQGGSGLGLAYVKAVAQRHHGDAVYEDAAGGGARFSLRLPLLPKDDPEEDEANDHSPDL